jgi:hypothetical protein
MSAMGRRVEASWLTRARFLVIALVLVGTSIYDGLKNFDLIEVRGHAS